MPCRLHHNLICFGPRLLDVAMVGWTNFGVMGVFFCSGCDCKCYIFLHMLSLVNMDSFSNNEL
jgi:hypothetical protein